MKNNGYSPLPGGQSYKKNIYIENPKPGDPIKVYDVTMQMDSTGKWVESRTEIRNKNSGCGCLFTRLLPPAGVCGWCNALVCYKHRLRCRKCGLLLCPTCVKRYEQDDERTFFLCDTHYQEEKQKDLIKKTCKGIGKGFFSIFSIFAEVEDNHVQA